MSEKTKPDELTIFAAPDGGYIVDAGGITLFAGSLKEALAYIEGQFDPGVSSRSQGTIRGEAGGAEMVKRWNAVDMKWEYL